MATKSILKNVSIKRADIAKKLILAMESSERSEPKKVVISRTVKYVSRDTLRDTLGDI